MAYQVTVKPGLTQVTLPNGGIYSGGDVVVLSTDDFSTISATTLVELFSSVTQTGGGGAVAVESVNGQTGEVVLEAADVGAATNDHTHTPASIGAAASSHTHTPASIGAAAASHTHAAGDVASGTFAAARIPALPASQISTGVFSADRLPKGAAVANLDAEADAATIVTTVNALLAALRVNHLTP
ncbi:hypothetical protein [Streptomyces sp. NPDC088727]|uniref:hypothetical protein n=1 Tax=Streptomyces sp. NPDC088727 TaxID=3365875 RepID=UPI0037F207D7